MILETAGLISIGTWLGSKIADKGFDTLYAELTKSDEINTKFYKAVEETSKQLQKKYPTIFGGSIEYFFKREEVFNELIKLLFKNSIVDQNKLADSFDINSLPENFIYEFITDLKKELAKDRDLDTILANKEIFIVIQGLGQNIEIISNNSTLTHNEVSTIRNFIEQRIGEIFSYEEFLKAYSKNALNNLSQVNFIGLGVDISIKRKRKDLQDVFVRPYFRIVDKKAIKKNIKDEDDEFLFEDESNLTTYSSLFEPSNKLVILGNPGSGKSVLVKSIICDILRQSKSEFSNKEVFESLPFRIELRKYLSFKKLNRGNILKYLVSLLEDEYGINNITEVILDNILKEKKSFVFFDGLDEIFKIEDKIDIKSDIENFHNIYPKVRSLTTSRIIGYEEAKLQEDQFCEFNILNFNNEQVKEYLEKWYEKEEEDPEIRQKEIEGFLSKQHEIDRELVSNPLLLSLIVILYRNILKLPESKLEIYQSCTKTLVDKWDASKELIIDLEPDIYKNKEKILADLAYWQYEQLSGESVTISYEKARNTVAFSLRDKLKIADDFNSDDLAERFMSYAQKRSIYFDNNFTHKTFLEYYTAYWIYSNIEKKHKIDDRNQIISKYISNSFWHIVLELLLNMIDKDQADAEIMDDLLEKQIDKNPSSLPFILSTITSFKNISNLSLTKAVNSSIEALLKVPKSREKNTHAPYRETLESQIFYRLRELYFSEPNAKVLIKEKLIKTEVELPELAELNYILYLELIFFGIAKVNERLKFELSNKALFDEFIKTNPYIFILNSYFFNSQSEKHYFDIVLNFIDNFGVKELFVSNDAIFQSVRLGNFLNFYLRNQVLKDNINDMSKNLECLESKGLSKKDIISFITSSNLFFGFPEEVLEPIVNRIDIENDKQIIKILLILLFGAVNHPHFSYSDEKIDFLKLVKGRRKQNLLTKIFNIKKMDNKIRAINKI